MSKIISNILIAKILPRISYLLETPPLTYIAGAISATCFYEPVANCFQAQILKLWQTS
jgi:hypothetical protein